jgi:hypothetical protein
VEKVFWVIRFGQAQPRGIVSTFLSIATRRIAF